MTEETHTYQLNPTVTHDSETNTTIISRDVLEVHGRLPEKIDDGLSETAVAFVTFGILATIVGATWMELRKNQKQLKEEKSCD